MPVFIHYHHLLLNLLDIFIGSFHCAIHFGPVWRRIVMLDFELHAEFSDHRIVEIGSIIGDDPFRDVVLADEVMLDESGYNILSD